MRDQKKWNTCSYKGCDKRAKTRRSRRCQEHHDKVRSAQTLRNNRTWYGRRKDGTAKHRKVYRGRATAWARAQKARKAKAKAKKAHAAPLHLVEKAA